MKRKKKAEKREGISVLTWRDLVEEPSREEALGAESPEGSLGESLLLNQDDDEDLSPEEAAWLDFMRDNRPRTRGDCVNGLRPCPYLGCKHHTALEVLHRSVRVHDTPLSAYSCTLDVIDEFGELSPGQIDELLGFKEPYSSYIIEHALKKLRAGDRREMLQPLVDGDGGEIPSRY